MILATWILLWIIQTASSKLIEIQDKNEFKKVLASHSNILVAYLSESNADPSILALLNEVSIKGNKLAKFLFINCQNNKKLCKHYKVNPKLYIIQHFHKGKFNKVYDRKMRVESILSFLEDPTGDISWDEDDTAKDVVHIKSSQDFQRIVSKFKTNIPTMMLMFYAPWCGFCKQMKPEFAAAATILKGKTIFVGINGDIPTTDDLKRAFNISGYPSVFLIQEGSKVFRYENENSRDALVAFVSNPTKPASSPQQQQEAPWSDEPSEIEFLTDASFNEFINGHESVLVMFYAPWCGHCKSMKPAIVEAAARLKQSQVQGRIAAIDSTQNRNTSEIFQIKGFPTLKYFQRGQFMFDVHDRSADALVKFMLNPQKPPPEPKADLPWKEQQSAVLHPTASEWRPVLKRFKHALVMFYAPWCGHCKSTKPAFTAAANRLREDRRVAFVAVDCTDADLVAICTSEGITGYPTLRYFNYGKNTTHSQYALERQEDDFVAFMTNPLNPKLEARRHWRHLTGHEVVLVLDSADFNENIASIRARNGGALLVMFYSPRSPPSMVLRSPYVQAALRLQQALPLWKLAAVDAVAEANLANQYGVNGYPTIVYFPPAGAAWTKYNGEHSEDAIVDFAIKNEMEYRRRIEEETRHRQEQERLRKEAEENRIREENERVERLRIAEENERKRLEEEAEAKRKIEEIEKEEARVKDEMEQKQREEEEEQRIKEEIEKRKLDEKDQNKLVEKTEEVKPLETTEQPQNESESPEGETSSSKPQQKQTGVEFSVLIHEDHFTRAVKSNAIVIFFITRDGRAPSVRSRLERLLKDRENTSGYDIDCARATDLCNEMRVENIPVVLVYKAGEVIGSLSGTSWGASELNELIDYNPDDHPDPHEEL